MKSFALRCEKSWDALARLVSRRSLRFYLLLLLCAVLCLPGQYAALGGIDSLSLNILGKFRGAEQNAVDIAIVSVPDATVRRWSADVYHSGELSSLVSNVLHASQARLALVLPRPLFLGSTELDRSLAEGSDEDRRMLARKQYLLSLLGDQRVALGLSSWQPELAPAHTQGQAYAWLRSWFNAKPGCEGSCAAPLEPLPWLPLLQADRVRLWLELDNGSVIASLMAAMLELNNRPELALKLAPWLADSVLAPLASDAYITEGRFDSHSARVSVLSLDEALAVSSFPSYVLIGPASQLAALKHSAHQLYSLNKAQAYVQPWWAEPLVRVLLLIFVLLLSCLASANASLKLRLGAIASLLFFALGLQFYAALALSLWLPMSLLFVVALLLLPLLSLWRLNHRRQLREQVALQHALSDASDILEAEHCIAEAVALLAQAPRRSNASARIQRMLETLAKREDKMEQALTLLNQCLLIMGPDKRLLSLRKRLRASGAMHKSLAKTLVRGRSGDGPKPQRLGRYQIKEELGRGAVGVVYLGFDPAIARKVAVKTLDSRGFAGEHLSSLKARFFREAEAAGRLNHPNIVSVYDLGEEGDLAYIAMDFVDGQPLSEFVSAERLLPVSTVYRIVYDAAMALHYAHENQIVHRDIKPGNLMYSNSPYTLKVADFGIARLLDASRTSTGEILGSPLYMAPEQLRGARVGATADIFSLGVSFYQLLCGALPFNADNLAALTYEIIHTKHRSVRRVRKELPASASRIINQCLQKNPDDRYASAAELAQALRRAIKRDFPAMAKKPGY
ncbi:serine/threonine-protein kinase [Agaribacterium haliotis]|uniref:serine/threonine-protein kinase n=1 Tax=Agaribacterium haliotis TaxID=2013869 RepID=UPI000BB57ED4|nr:serine/threonine-protein kinase [Agaribacterium haliotis]